METPYSTPREVNDLRDCFFYHTMDIPGYGRVEGQFDLREGARQYLGNVDLRGKRVLEVGTASGFLCFHMEQQGADVVAYDLSPDDSWDIVPFAKPQRGDSPDERRQLIQRINNAYWLSHRAHGSKARVVHGTVYGIPESIGPVDVATFGCVLLHVRDPFLALQNASRLVRETLIVTELVPWWQRNLLTKVAGPKTMETLEQIWEQTAGRLTRPNLTFLPDPRTGAPNETWWVLGPRIVKEFLAILGFERLQVSYHWQRYEGQRHMLFTVVGRR